MLMLTLKYSSYLEMATDDLSFLLDLPPELQCKILKGPLTFNEYLNIKSTSIQLGNMVNDCLEELISEGYFQYLQPNIVSSMKRIQTITPRCLIVIHDEEELYQLAHHPTLKRATFYLDALMKERSIYSLIGGFFNRYPTFGNSCQDCQERYSFTFQVGDVDFGKSITVSEGGLDITLAISAEETPEFYRDIAERVPICQYRGFIEGHIRGIGNLPCLSKFLFVVDPGYGYPNRYARLFLEEVMTPHIIKEYFAAYSENFDVGIYHRFISQLKRLIVDRKIIFPEVTTFFPINILDTGSIKRYFPNLTSIAITLSSIRKIASWKVNGIIRRTLMSYPSIILVNDLSQDLDENYYLKIFPEELHNRITFVDSNQTDI